MSSGSNLSNSNSSEKSRIGVYYLRPGGHNPPVEGYLVMRWLAVFPELIVAFGLQALYAAGLETEAREILQRRCLSCHGSKTKVAGLDLSGRESALRGGSKGPALKPGFAAGSLLLERALKGQMPPDAPLPASESEILRRWIEAGAPW